MATEQNYWETWQKLIEVAAKFQEILPDAILVGGSGTSVHLRHRFSFDADHIMENLSEKFEETLEFLENNELWQTARINPPKIILGNFHGVETGLRQLKRENPLEIEKKNIKGNVVAVPTISEMIRIKGWMIISRNALRDYLDFAALCYHNGIEKSAQALKNFNDYYYDLKRGKDVSPLFQLTKQLAEPKPHDLTKNMESEDKLHYKGIQPPFDSWNKIKNICREISVNLMFFIQRED